MRRKNVNSKHEIRAKHPEGINSKQMPMFKIQMPQTISLEFLKFEI